MEISELMTTNVVHVSPDDTLRAAREIFHRQKFHHLIVLREGKLAGVLSDRDVLRSLSPFVDTKTETLRDQQTLETKVSQIMTRNVLAVAPEISVHTAGQLMLAKRVSCLPVATEDKRVVGILTLKTVLRHYIKMDSFNFDSHKKHIINEEKTISPQEDSDSDDDVFSMP